MDVNIVVARWVAFAPLNHDGTQTYAVSNEKMSIYLDHTGLFYSGAGHHYDYVKQDRLLS